ncbi:hypothetical protein EV401DRAFT_1330642 [Pisolithus croceorrhizus]|nr:hypothetical protein EV401DRAFT_1330642 [Pisolithus croceorrhizus]
MHGFLTLCAILFYISHADACFLFRFRILEGGGGGEAARNRHFPRYPVRVPGYPFARNHDHRSCDGSAGCYPERSKHRPP